MDLADDISYSVHDVEDAIVAGHVQLKWLANQDQRNRVLGYTQQWYLPDVDTAEIDAALQRLEATDVWVRHADGSRALHGGAEGHDQPADRPLLPERRGRHPGHLRHRPPGPVRGRRGCAAGDRCWKLPS